jgi:hypothetical protein
MVKGASNFLDQQQMMLQLAKTSCLPDVIRMVKGLDFTNLNEHVKFFNQYMEGLPNRLSSIYSVYRFFARKVIGSIVNPNDETRCVHGLKTNFCCILLDY